MAFFVSENNLLCYVALNDFVREVPTHRVATECVDLKALLQREAASLRPMSISPAPEKYVLVSIGNIRRVYRSDFRLE